MSSEPSTPRATVTSPRQTTRIVSVSSPGTIVGGAFILLLGLALGIANQGAGPTAMALRVPALLAALLMVGQGVLDIRKSLPHPVYESMADPLEPNPRGRGELAVVRPGPPSPPLVLGAKPTPSNLGVPIGIMFLAAWLGLADLRVSSTASLTALSLVSAFVLFAIGWSLLPARR